MAIETQPSARRDTELSGIGFTVQHLKTYTEMKLTLKTCKVFFMYFVLKIASVCVILKLKLQPDEQNETEPPSCTYALGNVCNHEHELECERG